MSPPIIQNGAAPLPKQNGGTELKDTFSICSYLNIECSEKQDPYLLLWIID